MWSPELAILIARAEKIEMNEDHRVIVNYLRQYYENCRIAQADQLYLNLQLVFHNLNSGASCEFQQTLTGC
jgi:sulfur relay (sulfurtransferase) DsrC/TusE family protein